MDPLGICVNTQTPLLQFVLPERYAQTNSGPGPTIELSELAEGEDYRFSPGGVTRMVLPMLQRLVSEGVLKKVHWVALNPRAPGTIEIPGMTLHYVSLEPDRMASYAGVKEAIWARAHEADLDQHHDNLFWTEAFSEYTYYNRVTAELIRELDAREDFDAFYVHDFQQLPIGVMLGTLKPKIFRWHIPFHEGAIPESWRSMLSTYLSAYDVVIVSARKYAKSLKAFGYAGKIVREYPAVDPATYTKPSETDVAATCERFGVKREDTIALLVGRMDPTKSQDRAIRSFSEIAPRHPHLKLVLVGDGSFSGSQSGLGMSKSEIWRRTLEEQVKRAGLKGRVMLTGHVNQLELDSLYERACFTLLPSPLEGFGLVAVEGWLHNKPVIVARGAGVAELVQDGENGLLFSPEVPGDLGAKMERLLAEDAGPLREKLARRGAVTAKKCSIDAAVTVERQILNDLFGG
ncbi:MAG: glycosyltransferase family 4 protein [Thermoplasmata archaeon]